MPRLVDLHKLLLDDDDIGRGAPVPVAKTVADTQDAKRKRAVLDTLAKLGQGIIGDDSLKFEGTQVVLPASMNGNIKAAIKYLEEYESNQSTPFGFVRQFMYRPMDGAHAFQQAMLKLHGTSGTGEAIRTMFGDIPPTYVTVNVGPNKTTQVPWNRVAFSPLEATFDLGAANKRGVGAVFSVEVRAPRKYRAHIEAFFAVVEEQLRTNSIYRGKAFTGTNEPIFLDTTKVDPEKVVYADDTLRQLDANLWSLVRYTDEMRKQGVPLKRAVLVEGPYGTGKTLAGMLTAREAVNNGWTFILARPGDNLNEVLQTAQLYAPAVVWYEDLDVVAKGSSDTQLSALLDSLDGITNKGVEILAGFTTNHVQKIQMGALRCGRIDAVIHVGGLDAAGFEKLIKVTVPRTQLGTVDYAVVAVEMDGFLPAFAKEAITRAMSYSISRNKGRLGRIDTEDLVLAAKSLRPHLQLMLDAEEGVKPSALDRELSSLMAKAIDGIQVVDPDCGDQTAFVLKESAA